MTRIIAGTARGRTLRTPKGDATRPTSDRVREALFSSVEALASLDGMRVLDLYAGSGALGLEAWSRGAGAVAFVEADRRTADLIRDNARAVGCTSATVTARSVATTLAEPAAEPFDLVFSDPPYPLAEERLAADLAALATGWLAPEALIVIERSSRSPEPTWPTGISPLPGKRGQRRYGETTLWFAEPTPEPTPDPSAAADAVEHS